MTSSDSSGDIFEGTCREGGGRAWSCLSLGAPTMSLMGSIGPFVGQPGLPGVERALDVRDDLPHLCPAEGGTGRLRGVREADLSHLLGRFLVLEKNYG